MAQAGAEQDDIFAELHSVEQDSFAKGAQDGRRDGMVAGIWEGRELGAQKGYEIGVELGFYAGCVRTWRALQSIEQSHPRRANEQPASTPSGSQDQGTAGLPAQTATSLEGAVQGITLSEPASSSTSTPSSQPATASKGSLLIHERAEKALTTLEQLLKEFPLTDPQDEQLHDLLERIRGRFKVVASMMGLLHDYMPRDTDREGGNAGSTPGAAAAASLSF